jgi:uncharacterized protein (TIGR00251 family)
VTTDIDVHVRPGAKRTVVGGTHDGVLTVAVAAPPADGQANEAVRRAVADAFAIRVSAVDIVRGHSSRRKQLRLEGDDVAIAARLAELRG